MLTNEEALRKAESEYMMNGSPEFRAGFKSALAWLRSQWEPVECAAPQPAIPDGWRLVPVEPTQEMIGAFADVVVGEATWQESSDKERAETTAGFVPAYSAMLAAAPEPKSC